MPSKSTSDLLAELEKAEEKVFELKSKLVSAGELNSYEKIQGLVKATVDQMHEGVQIIDREWRFVYLNEAAIKHARRPREELLGKTMPECYPGIQHTRFFEVIQHSMSSREPKSVENFFEYSDKTRCWYELHIEPHSHGILIRSLDITDRKKIEEGYFQSQKMEALGRLAGSVAHDFNNKLGIMQIFCELAIENGGKDQKTLRSHLEDVLAAIGQASALSKQLLAFSRKQVFQMQTLDLNAQIKKISESLRELFGERIKLNTELASHLGFVRADPAQIAQVLLNLCMNSKDAMSSGGVITLVTKNVMLTEGDCSECKELAPGPHVILEVTDTGNGIAPELIDRIFDPFFTTKLKDVGTGLGLATVYGIIHQCQGHVKVESQVGVGTTFRIFLPQTFGDVTATDDQKNTGQSGVAGKRILLIEDDNLLRKAYLSSLEKTGYAVLSAENSKDARDIWQKEKGQFDLLLTDIVIDEFTGIDLAQEFKSANTKMKIIFVSGFAKNERMLSNELFADSKFLQKPVSIPHLLTTIEAALTSQKELV